MKLKESTLRIVERRCPSIVAERILERSSGVVNPDAYVLIAVRNWEIEQHRRAVASEKRRQDRALSREDQLELEAWDQECRAKAFKVLGGANSINTVTLAMWIDSGLSGRAFANQEGISEDCLYQRKLRARHEVLEQLDARTAAWLYQYGAQRISVQRGETRRKTTCRCQRGTGCAR